MMSSLRKINGVLHHLVGALLLVSFLACSAEAPPPAPAEEPAPQAESAPEPPPEQGAQPEADEKAAAGGPLNVDEQGRGLRGYDAVAYHTTGQATAGDSAFSHQWNGAEWLFVSAENRDAFAQDPDRYSPSNGGYCTFGVVLKKKLDVDPEVFLVDQERLFLFLNPEVKEKFLADKDGNLSLVTGQWPEIAPKHPDELASEGG